MNARLFARERLTAALAAVLCAVFLAVPALWARAADAARNHGVRPRPVVAGTLDEQARQIPVLYALHTSNPDTLTADPCETDQAVRALTQKLEELTDAGVLTGPEQVELLALLGREPTQTSHWQGKGFEGYAMNWTLDDGRTQSLYLLWDAYAGGVVELSAPVVGVPDATERLDACLAALGLDVLGDWTDTADGWDVAARRSALGQTAIYCDQTGGNLYLRLRAVPDEN